MLFFLPIGIGIFFFGAEVMAKPLCEDADKLRGFATSCHGNKVYVQAAEACLRKIDNAISVEQGVLGLTTTLQNQAAAKSQDSMFRTNVSDLSQAKTTLESLIFLIRKAETEMKSYSEFFSLPGGMSRSVAESLGLSSFLDSFACYKENRRALSIVRGKNFKKEIDLTRAWHAVGRLSTATSENNRMNTNGGVKIPAKVENTTTRLPAGRDRRASEISRPDEKNEILDSFHRKN